MGFSPHWHRSATSCNVHAACAALSPSIARRSSSIQIMF